MYAILKTGGKQYKVSEGDVIYVEKLGMEAVSYTHLDVYKRQVWRYLPLRRLWAGRDDAARAAGAQEGEVPSLVDHPLFALDGARFAAAKLR